MVYSGRFKINSNTASRLTLSGCSRTAVFVLAITAQGLFQVAAGQSLQTPQATPEPQSSSKKAAAKKKYTLRITREGVTGVSLKAEKAKISEIAADLSKQIGVRVLLGASMEKEAITVEFSDLTLEPAVRLLAPRVYIDYEIRANAQPTPLGIFLLGYADPDPKANAVVEASSQAVLIEGNTEDTAEKTEIDPDDPLQIDLDDNQLTIKSKKQPLGIVVLEIADILGVPAEIKYDSDEIVNTEIKSTPFEDAIPRLSPNIRLYLRADLTKSQRIPLRLAIVSPPTKVSDQ